MGTYGEEGFVGGPMVRKGLGGLWGGRIRGGLWGGRIRRDLWGERVCGDLWRGRVWGAYGEEGFVGAYGEEGFVGARKAPQLDIIISSENPLIHNMICIYVDIIIQETTTIICTMCLSISEPELILR